MKKTLSLLMLLFLAAFLTMGLAGCGNSSTPTGVEEVDDGQLTEEEEAGEEAIGQE